MKHEQTSGAQRDELRPEYDLDELQGAGRGKYYQRYQASFPVVRLTDDVASAFPSEEAVNQALRLLLQLARQQVSQKSA